MSSPMLYARGALALTVVFGHARGVSAQDFVVTNASGMKLMVAPEHRGPVLRIVRPGRPTTDRSIEVIFPEHVTATRRVGGGGGIQELRLYQWREGIQGEPAAWREVGQALEYERELPNQIHFLARATLESDGVRIHYEVRNGTRQSYQMIYAVTDPRMTGDFHDERLLRTYVHHAEGFDLLASETPERIDMPLEQWLPLRYKAWLTLPVPAERVTVDAEGNTIRIKSRPADASFMATFSTDQSWMVASYSGGTISPIWSNPALTCQHVDPQTALTGFAHKTLEMKLFVMQGTLEEVYRRARAVRRERATPALPPDSRSNH